MKHYLIFRLIAASIVLLLSIASQAEVYRWTDAQGKVHYTDKKPASNAEDISASVKKQNIDSSSEELKKVEQILRKENDADRDYYRQQQAKKQEHQQEMSEWCSTARDYLSKLKGPVIFKNEDGTYQDISEKERQKRVVDLEAKIKKECP